MRQWIDSSIVSETNGVHELGAFIRQHVESEENLQPRLGLDTFDFLIHDASLTFVVPPKPPLPAKEKVLNDRLSIEFLRSIIQELMDSFRDTVEVDKTTIANMLNRQVQNTKLLQNYGGISEAWRGLTFSTIFEILNKFDVDPNGNIGPAIWWREFAVSMCLINSLPVSKSALDKYRQLILAAEPVDEEKFVAIEAWFDSKE